MRKLEMTRPSSIVVAGMLVGALVLGAWPYQSAAHANPAPPSYAADKGPARLDVSAYPAQVKEAYKVFASRCGRCHTLARAINTNLSPGAWKTYVKRMMDKPGSAISPAQGKTIYRFLKFYQTVKDSKRPSKAG